MLQINSLVVENAAAPSRRLVPVVLCGGAGSRLWPVSRELQPKPFIRLADGQSLLQKAFLRGILLPSVSNVVTVTNQALFFKAEDELCEVNWNGVATDFILEPFGRNTAPAIAAAALQVAAAHGNDAILLVLAADHLIANEQAFQLAVAAAVNLAAQGKLVTFGIQPDRPEIGYGYIEAEGNAVLRFVEKPTLEQAREYMASGSFLWNSGIFCFSAGAMLDEMARCCPDILAATRECVVQSRQAAGPGANKLELNAELFKSVPDNSIDYAVMEKSRQVAVVPCDIGWSDIGSWEALGDLDVPDSRGNRVRGQVLLHNSNNCTVHGGGRLVGVVGIEDAVIVDTPDALLVASKARTQDVKHLYAELKAAGNEVHKLHRTVHRPWGTYTVLEQGADFKIKRIEVKPGASLSLQMHRHRSEHWVVVSGTARVINGDREIIVNTNESTFIPAGHKHRLSNLDDVPCVMIEVQSGEYVGEDDIVRFEDVYGRASDG